MYRLEAEPREEGNPRELRRRGLIPGVVYGHGVHQLVQIRQGKLERLLGKITRSSRITLTLDGGEWPTFIKEIQYDPLTDRVLHIDFYYPSAEREIKMEVPILLRGEPQGRRFGGVLRRLRTKVLVKGLPERIPEKIELDVSGLDVGEALHIRDLPLEGVDVLTAPETPIALVKVPRREVVRVGAEAEEEAAEAGEELEGEPGEEATAEPQIGQEGTEGKR